MFQRTYYDIRRLADSALLSSRCLPLSPRRLALSYSVVFIYNRLRSVYMRWIRKLLNLSGAHFS